MRTKQDLRDHREFEQRDEGDQRAMERVDHARDLIPRPVPMRPKR